jgi:hypothetical protein
MSKVKGAVLMNLAKLIRDNKDRSWSKYLSEDDLKVLQGTVMPNSWYPMEIYERAAFGIFNEIGQGKVENAWTWGKFLIEDLGKRFYRNLVTYQDPVGSLEKCHVFLKQWFQFDDPKFIPIEVEPQGKNQAKIIFRYERPLDFFEASVHQIAGSMERIVELNGGKEVKTSIVEMFPKRTVPYAVLNISWK